MYDLLVQARIGGRSRIVCVSIVRLVSPGLTPRLTDLSAETTHVQQTGRIIANHGGFAPGQGTVSLPLKHGTNREFQAESGQQIN